MNRIKIPVTKKVEAIEVNGVVFTKYEGENSIKSDDYINGPYTLRDIGYEGWLFYTSHGTVTGETADECVQIFIDRLKEDIKVFLSDVDVAANTE